MTESAHKPHVSGGDRHAPLDALVRAALRRAGTFSVSRTDGETMMMFIEFANQVVEDVRRHPYWTGERIDYYTSQSESRPIPDEIVILGLLSHYTIQQGSEKAGFNLQMYQSRMADLLYERMYGNAPLERRVVDGGSDPLHHRHDWTVGDEGYDARFSAVGGAVAANLGPDDR